MQIILIIRQLIKGDTFPGFVIDIAADSTDPFFHESSSLLIYRRVYRFMFMGYRDSGTGLPCPAICGTRESRQDTSSVIRMILILL